MFRLILFIASVLTCAGISNGVNALVVKRQSVPRCGLFSEQQLDVTQCTQRMRQGDGNVKDLDRLFLDAQTIQNSPDFISYALEIMYQYMHCATPLDTVTALYFNVTKSHLPPLTSVWWLLSTKYLSSPSSSSNTQNYTADDDLLRQKIANISRDTHPACVLWLIEHYKEFAAEWWKRGNPNFPDPNTYTSAANSSATTATTTIAITTAQSTTATTQLSTATQMTTSATTATTTLASTTHTPLTSIPTSTAGAVRSCTVCKDLDCFLAPQVQRCPLHSSFCIITIADSTGLSRSISRGCADKARCDSIAQNGNCAQVQSGYHPGTTCEFCCSGDNCNSPPALIPESASRYPRP